ncbi:hypothetical protein [Portibacter marinus]|uniref:hypothetical protein n=1 Tax=Portibacter marinus TaxID=2898660 RepID=UPI001F369905|nr:hypothetical protein [Portibacter marinus]
MNRTQEIFSDKFQNALKKLGISNTESVSYIIIPTSEKENYTNWDDIFRFWSTPTFKGIRLNYNDVVCNLYKEHKNTIPLWIKVSYKREMPIVLEISQRFRKLKDVIERNPENSLAPFELEGRIEIDQIVNTERSEAIRILMFKRELDKRTKDILGDEISLEELKENLKEHLNNYRFYPANRKHQKIGDINYSSLIINQEYKTGKFSICNAENLEEEIKSELIKIEAIEFYIEHMIQDEFCGLKVKH